MLTKDFLKLLNSKAINGLSQFHVGKMYGFLVLKGCRGA